jgi:thymidylate synthase
MWPFSAIKKHQQESDRLRDEVESLSTAYHELKQLYQELTDAHQDAIDVAKASEEKVKEVEDKLAEAEASENQVRLSVNDELTVITPFTSVKPDMWETFVEAGMVSDTTVGEGRKFAMQLALMTVAYDGLAQILEQFAPEPKEAE